MTGDSLNIVFGPTSALPSFGSVNSVAESSDAGCFGKICQAIVSQQNSNSDLPPSSSLNADVSASAASTKTPVTQPQIKQKEPDVSQPLLSLGAMLGTPTLIVLDQLPSPDTSPGDGVFLAQFNVENTPDTRSEALTSNSSSIESRADAPILSSLSANASSSALFSSVLNKWSLPQAVPEACTPPEPLSQGDRALTDKDPSFNQDDLGNSNPTVKESKPTAIASGKPPAVGEPAILTTDLAATALRDFDRLPDSDLPSTVEPTVPRHNANVQAQQPESRFRAETASVMGPTDFQRASLSDETARVSSSSRQEVLQASPHQEDSHPYLLGGLQKLTNAASSPSFGMGPQAAPTGHPSHSQPSTDSQRSLSAPTMIQATIQTSTSNSPAGSEPTPDDASIQGPNPAEERDEAASQSPFGTASATGSSSLFESVNKNLRTDAASKPKRDGQAGDEASSVASQAPASNPVSDINPAGSGMAIANGNGSKSPSPEKSGADDGASYRHSDLPLSPASSAGPVQLAQILNKASHAEMRIGLNTAAFGDVEIRTVLHATDVGIQIGSEKGNLQALLTNDLPSISGYLQQQNLHLTQVTFQSPGFGSPGGSSQQQDSSHRRPLVVQPHSEHSLNPEVTQDEVGETPRIRSLSGLSVLA